MSQATILAPRVFVVGPLVRSIVSVSILGVGQVEMGRGLVRLPQVLES